MLARTNLHGAEFLMDWHSFSSQQYVDGREPAADN